MAKIASHGELALIHQIRRTFPPTRNPLISLGIGDDCAILQPKPGHELLVTTDFTLENRHFRRNIHPPTSIGHRCLARGLSDLAAMGATPLAAFLSLALPAAFPATAAGRRWITGFLEGLRTLARATRVPLAGGDTAQSPTDLILADIVLLGQAPTGTSLRRSEARPGDLLYVTGRLGGAAAELRTLLAANRLARPRLGTGHPHLYPEPRLALGQALRSRATACIDLSDGLSTDLTHLCKASGLLAVVEAASLPIHALAAIQPDALHLALNGGEDYELLFAASRATRIPRTLAGTPITRIGLLQKADPRQPRIALIAADGSRHPLSPSGWQHFT